MATITERKDAFSVDEATITVGEDPWGWVTGVSIDGRSPENMINVIGGQVRRKSPKETSWSADAVVLYDNIAGLKALQDVRFNIVITMTNPDPDAPNDNKTQTITLENCKISEENITLNDSSTYRMSGNCDAWTVSPGH